ncbi:hypothetical protein ACLMJK_006144 [Lecanora helva]
MNKSLPSSSSIASTSTYHSALEYQDASDHQQGSLRICPHQQLSWERFHRIANLGNIKDGQFLEALTKLPEHYHHSWLLREIGAIGTKLLNFKTKEEHYRLFEARHCHIKDVEKNVSFLGDAMIQYDAPRTRGAPGEFILVVSWLFMFERVFLRREPSKQTLATRLNKSGIRICSHLKLSHHDVLEASWKLIQSYWKLGHPSEDPVDNYEAKAAKDKLQSDVKCHHCKTILRVDYFPRYAKPSLRLMILRFLGEGKSAKDPTWRAQCGL